MEEKVIEISQLVKERDLLIRTFGNTENTKHWTKIEVCGEDGAESSYCFSLGGASDNNKENQELVRQVHNLISKNFEKRLEVVNEKIAKLLK